MTRSQSALLALIASGILLAPTACSSDKKEVTLDPGGGANYGADLIGYKQSAASRAAAEQDFDGAFGDPTISLNGGGATTGAGASSGYPGDGDGNNAYEPPTGTGGNTGTGGSTGSGGNVGMGGMGGGPLTHAIGEGRGALLAGGASGEGPRVEENPFVAASDETTSTFSIDVDGGSYTLTRAAVRDGSLPNPDSVRVEEFLNYFHFHYKEPEGNNPLSLYTEWADCPWNEDREILMIGVQGQEVSIEDMPPANLVYLLDVSGSMSAANKLPLLKRGFRMLTAQLRPQDRVSIVTYAGADRVVLDGVSGSEKAQIDAALTNLQSGGSTNGAGGIQKAYELAQEHFIEGGTNRVLLATDGDFNVGLSETGELVDFISEKRDTGVFLSVYGYGTGNYNDDVAEQLADNGNGIYFYIDGPEETQRAFQHTISGSLITVAKDVKLQVEFNPTFVKGYRLIGYENRILSNSSFNDDGVDAGELGAGLSVTALYEIIPVGSHESLPEAMVGTVPEAPEEGEGGTAAEAGFDPVGRHDMAQVRLRYKDSDANVSQAMSQGLLSTSRSERPSFKLLFAAGVSEFAMQLRGSQYLPERREGLLVDQIHSTLSLDGEGAIAEAEALMSAAHALN